MQLLGVHLPWDPGCYRSTKENELTQLLVFRRSIQAQSSELRSHACRRMATQAAQNARAGPSIIPRLRGDGPYWLGQRKSATTSSLAEDVAPYDRRRGLRSANAATKRRGTWPCRTAWEAAECWVAQATPLRTIALCGKPRTTEKSMSCKGRRPIQWRSAMGSTREPQSP